MERLPSSNYVPPPKPTTAAGTGGAPGITPVGAVDGPGGTILSTAGTGTGSGAAGSGLKEGQCAKQDVTTTRIVPTIWLVVDGSGSMVELLGDKSRWVALREALMDPMAGVVKTLEHDVKWGLIMYDGVLGVPVPLPDGGIAMFSSPPATTCPRIIAVEPKKDNFADIDKSYPPDPLGGSTPTDKALLEVIKHLPTGAAVGPDVQFSPTIVVLATDGAPNDLCAMAFPPPDVQPAVISAVQQLAAAGNKTYVISLAGSDVLLTQHLTQVAQVGGTGKPPFIPANKADLIKVFKDIIGPTAACDIKLNGKVKVGSECMGGKIEINGVALPCGTDNGWRLKDESTISITGTACTMYQENLSVSLHADFPCEIFKVN
jgi:hypothetical protein